MKKQLLLFNLILTFLLLVANNYANSQNNQSNEQALRMLKEFYTSYITEIAIGPAGRTEEMKLHLIQRKYCTTKLLHYIPKFIEQHDEDPLLMAQDSDTSSLKTLSIKKDNKRKNIYSVSYIANPSHKITIHLSVIKENGSFKIDSIW
jgi:hypothetical protein